MAEIKTCYLVQNPLECMYHARRLVTDNKERHCIVVLPRHIEPEQFESYLLEGQGSVSGVEIHKISSLPRKMIGRLPEGERLKRVDQVALSEHFEGDHSRGVVRSLLNSVLELRLSSFDLAYVEHLLASKPNPEYGMLLKVFRKYEIFLKSNRLNDDADFKRLLVDALSDPNRKPLIQKALFPSDSVLIFAGFTEYTSAELMLIYALNKNAQVSYIVGPDILIPGLDYSKKLAESLTSLGYSFEKLESFRKEATKLYELRSPSEEAYFVSSSVVGTSVGSAGAFGGAGVLSASASGGSSAMGTTAIYAPADLDLYYSLFKYILDEKVSVRSSVRLDRSKLLSLLTGAMRIRTGNFGYRDIFRLLSYPNLWENYDEIRKLMSYLAEKALFPSDRDYFARLQSVEKIKTGATQVLRLLDAINGTLPSSSQPLGYISYLKALVQKTGLGERIGISDRFELSTVENLIYRVANALPADREMNIEEFSRKLMLHAEENYLLRGLPHFSEVEVASVRLITSNTADHVWFVGMNQESARNRPVEDIIVNDQLVMALRAEDFILPTSTESKAIKDKIIKDAMSGVRVTCVSNMGEPLECLQDLEKNSIGETVFRQMIASQMPGAFAESMNTATVINGYRPERVSPTAIERYIECPYRYFASNVIGLDKLDNDELLPPPSIQGRIAHEALQLLLPSYIKGEKVDVAGQIRQLIKNYEDKFKLNRSPANDIWANSITMIIDSVLKGEKEFFGRNPDLQILGTEQKLDCFVEIRDGRIIFSHDKNGMAFRGIADRIDVNRKDKTFYIVDYKKSTVPKKKDIDDGRNVQILLYLIASSIMFPELRPGAGCYMNLYNAASGKNPKSWRIIVGAIDDNICPPRSKSSNTTITISADNFSNEVASLLSKRAVDALKGMTSGVFTIAPVADLGSQSEEEEGIDEMESSSTERKICMDCDYKRCCGVKYWY